MTINYTSYINAIRTEISNNCTDTAHLKMLKDTVQKEKAEGELDGITTELMKALITEIELAIAVASKPINFLGGSAAPMM